MNRQRTAWFGLGFGVAVILLVVGIARYKQAYPMAFTDPPWLLSRYNPTVSVPREEPVFTTNSWGLVTEKSLSSEEKTRRAIDEFKERVATSGLRLSIQGEPQITVYAGKGNVVHANTEDTHFGVYYRQGEKAVVNTVRKRGEDGNGIPRDPWAVITAAGVNTNRLATWADPSQYPIQANLADVQGKVLALVEAMDVGGTNRYLLESARQLQMGVYHLPFYDFMFTTKEFYGQAARINREDLQVVVRVGGTDLKPGEGELVCYRDGGDVWRRREANLGKPKPVVPRVISP